MDAFYASVEQRDRPELRGRPVIVGADPKGRGVVSAASYEARVFGVRSAMPISRAARLCPEGVFLPVDMDKYVAVSRQIMAILDAFSPLVEPVSVDEAFVDLTGMTSLFGPAPDAVARMKQRIRSETGLTASAGLAANKFIAKVASDLRKPDGLVVVESGGEAEFLTPLPIERLWGVGRATAKDLAALGIASIGQLQRLPRATLVARLGDHGAALYELAFGRDLYRRAATLLARERLVQPVRLIGVSASALAAERMGQLGLLEADTVRRERLARAVDRLTGRFGEGTVI